MRIRSNSFPGKRTECTFVPRGRCSPQSGQSLPPDSTLKSPAAASILSRRRSSRFFQFQSSNANVERTRMKITAKRTSVLKIWRYRTNRYRRTRYYAPISHDRFCPSFLWPVCPVSEADRIVCRSRHIENGHERAVEHRNDPFPGRIRA